MRKEDLKLGLKLKRVGSEIYYIVSKIENTFVELHADYNSAGQELLRLNNRVINSWLNDSFRPLEVIS